MRSLAAISVALLLMLTICFVLLTPIMAKADDHGEDAAVSQVVSTEGEMGLSLFLIELYNDQRLMYSLLVTFTMAILGMVIGQATEMVLRLVGLRGGR